VEKNDIKILAALFIVFTLAFSAKVAITGNVFSGDATEYYSWLPTIIIDQDLNFLNQCMAFFEQNPAIYRKTDLKTEPGKIIIRSHSTEISEKDIKFFTTRCINEDGKYEGYAIHTIGPAILWLPFFLISLLISNALNLIGTGARTDGMGMISQYMTATSSIIYAVIGIHLSILLGTKLGLDKKTLQYAAVITVFGGFMLNYIAVEPGMSHATDFFTATAFFLLTYKTLSSKKTRDWALTGAAYGLLIAIRPQNIVFLPLPILSLAYNIRKGAKIKKYTKPIASFILAAIIASLPLIISWYLIYGDIASPHKSRLLPDLTPKIMELMFSHRNSLITSTPLLGLGLLGFMAFAIKKGWKTKNGFFLWALLLAFLLQTYVNSIAVDWWAGASVGARRFSGLYSHFIIGLAYVMQKTKYKKATAIIITIALAYNLAYTFAHNFNLVDQQGSVTHMEVLKSIWQLITS
jgi:hypothetical protein